MPYCKMAAILSNKLKLGLNSTRVRHVVKWPP